ncbi:P-loop containing nucleoside triphosphate hydrolase protein [Aspergillus avenaceus]|uniref:P-loop containing nucleoside triphosphate hydrolase protein n=1 Tax=Aspergillus avenaceus TaxID=36643 RepID=A0A5N6U2L4_ASPAV|nr:P-loop containing nucleoside triphosphate hydrolase protein [Aspergillus avenaceus]
MPPPTVSLEYLEYNLFEEFEPIENDVVADLRSTSLEPTVDTDDVELPPLNIPTEDSLQHIRQLQEIMDNTDYQRDNHEEACRILQIENPHSPRMRSMKESATFKFWQPVAIARILEIRADPWLRGAILGDSVGLGKTWEAIGVMLKIWEEYEQSVSDSWRNNEPPPKASPFLLVVPPSLIRQWCQEIRRVTDTLKIQLYYRSNIETEWPTIKSLLKKTDGLFDGRPVNGRTVVITSYQTLSDRHGPAAVKVWNPRTGQREERHTHSPPHDFPHLLDDCFKNVIIDEGHVLRNVDTSQSRAIQWLHADFHLLLSATPIYNSRCDFEGYVPILFKPAPRDLWYRSCHLGSKIFQLPPDQEASKLCCTCEAITKYVLDKKVPNVQAGGFLRAIFSRIMIRRTLFSRMQLPHGGSRSIGSQIPLTHRKVHRVQFTKEEMGMYETLAAMYYNALFMEDPDRPGKYVWNQKNLRLMCLLTTWLGLYYIEHILLADKITDACNMLQQGTAGKTFVESAAKKMNPESIYRMENGQIPVLESLLKGSPKMRTMLPIIREQVEHGEKAMVWAMFPAEQAYIATTLKEANIDVVVFHAGLTQDERLKLIEKFTQRPKECMVLVSTYNINAAGLNFQSLCRNVHIFSVSLSKSIINQAIGRVSRLGQKFQTYVNEYRVGESFDMILVNRAEDEAVPKIMTELSQSFMFNPYTTGSQEGECRWAVRNGKLYQLKNGRSVLSKDIKDTEDILKLLIRYLENT